MNRELLLHTRHLRFHAVSEFLGFFLFALLRVVCHNTLVHYYIDRYYSTPIAAGRKEIWSFCPTEVTHPRVPPK